MNEWNLEEAEKTYFISRWGDGFFHINDKGNLSLLPERRLGGPQIDIRSVVEEMKEQKIAFPAVIRFHDILHAQVKQINETFSEVIKKAKYPGYFKGVYPIKVNQMREVVEEIVEAGSPYDMGLEAGSKAELLSVLALNKNPRALTILNGYKDEEYLRLAILGVKLGRKVVVVIEKMHEIDLLLDLAEQEGVCPIIGLRSKISIKGKGKWKDSGGERAKFGLTAAELLRTVQTIRERGFLDKVKLLHFHMGSQITDIRTIKDAVTEGIRIYAKLCQNDVPLEYFDVGGGFGIDYDGSKSATNSSKNYNLHQYASDIIYGVKQICEEEGVPCPNIVTESGRAITAHHSCVITNVIGNIKVSDSEFNIACQENEEEHLIVKNMRETLKELSEDNYQEMYSDAKQLKENCLNAFKLGILSLEEKAKAETLFWKIAEKVWDLVEDKEFIPEELWHLEDKLSSQYLCNLSVFQSAADSWAIDQILPVVPIQRLHERPTNRCSLVDITCDSDGKIDKFIGDEEMSRTLPLHQLKDGEEYFLGVFLTGAYQDVMGDMHNLFGRLNEVHVFTDDDDPTDFYIEEVIRGSSTKNVLSTMQYNSGMMVQEVKSFIDNEVRKGKILPREGVRLIDFYEDCLDGYTYLK